MAYPRKKKRFDLWPHLNEAKKYYQVNIGNWKAGQKKKALSTIRYIDMLHDSLNGMDTKQIAKKYDCSTATAYESVNRAVLRVEIFLKLKEQGAIFQ